MKTKRTRVVAWITAVAVVGVSALLFREPIDHWMSDITHHADPGTLPAIGDDVEAGGVTRIAAGANGFEPSAITLGEGEHVLEFTRTVQNTCANAVVFPGTGARFELPLETPVRIPVTVKAGETIRFSCPMDMYHGQIVAGAASEEPGHDHGAGHDPSDIAYWTCSMHPSVKSSTPGTCPICSMDLIPVTHGEIETGVIIVDAARRQLIGVTTGPAAMRPITSHVRAAGRVLADETRVADVTLRYEAWVGKVYADFTGVNVTKGQALATFYNPQLWSLQEEYLEALRRGQREGGGNLTKAAETRLRLWGIEPAQIQALRERGSAQEYLTVYAPIGGTVMEKHVVAGSAVKAGEALYRIADLSVVWVEAEVYEDDIARMEIGQRARIAVQGVPGREFEGTVSYVYPYLDGQTRTGRVRFEVPNPDGALKPEMYADVTAEIPLGERLAVPEGAVIYAGKSHVVFVDLGEGRLEPRRVKIGARTRDSVEIVEGVEEGETVVTSGNFLIAAESKLKSGIEKW